MLTYVRTELDLLAIELVALLLLQQQQQQQHERKHLHIRFALLPRVHACSAAAAPPHEKVT